MFYLTHLIFKYIDHRLYIFVCMLPWRLAVLFLAVMAIHVALGFYV